jgi:hypothetical protein
MDAKGRRKTGKTHLSAKLIESTMDKSTSHSRRPRRNITWQSLPQVVPTCQHEYEAISGKANLLSRQCTKCGHQEVK